MMKLMPGLNESNRERPLADVMNDLREVFQNLMDAIAAFSDDDLQNLTTLNDSSPSH